MLVNVKFLTFLLLFFFYLMVILIVLIIVFCNQTMTSNWDQLPYIQLLHIQLLDLPIGC